LVLAALRPFLSFLTSIDIGSNDLCRRSSSPEQVAARITGLAAFIHTGYNVDYVIVGQILHRHVEPYPGYNAKVDRTNNELARLAATRNGVFFTWLRGLKEPLPSRFLPDGVHLNPFGYEKSVQGVRGAILRALNGTL
jgi:lysophospholipase L1-like esterase